MFSKILDILCGNVTYTLSGILFATATCFVLKTLLEYFLKLWKLWKAARKLPGPTGLPILGILPALMGDTESVLKTLVDWANSYPSPSCGWLGPKLHVVLYDPDNIKELLQNQRVIDKPDSYNFFRAILGDGLLTAEAKKWRLHRKLINTVFNTRVLSRYGEFLAQKAQEMVNEMESELHGKELQILHYLSPCTLRMIIGVVLGTSVKFETEELRSFYNGFNRLNEIIFIRMPRVWLHLDIIFNHTNLGQEFNKIVERLSRTVKKALQQAEAKENDTIANDETGGNTLPGLYMKLLRNRNDFTRQGFIYELHTVIGAGSLTLVSLMDFVTRMLAYHPDIQDKVYEELHSIYGSADLADRPVTLEDLPRLEYLECVIHESMRLFPPSGLIERAITKDLDIGSCTLPTGSTVLIDILHLHRNEKYWPDPLKFNPNRFLPENVAERIPGAYIPFSLGSRNCIGNKYAIMVAKILTATLLRRYILRVDTIMPIENIRLKGNIVLEYVEPWTLSTEERNPGKTETKR